MEDQLASVKQLLRSVLLSSKTGVKATRLQGEYKELCGSYIPHDKLGFSTLHEFMVSIDDVVRVSRDFQNELIYFAIADSSTQHIQSMIAKQKPKKASKKAPSSYIRNITYFKPRSTARDFNNPKIPPRFKSFYHDNTKKKMISKQYQSGSISKPMSFAKRGVFNESCYDVHKRHEQNRLAKNIIPLSSKQNIMNHFNRSGRSVYQNPLISHDEENAVDSLQEENCIKFKVSDKQVNEAEIKANLKKLLSVNSHGLSSTNLCSLYKDTYNADFPATLLNDIVFGTLSDFANVEKVNVDGSTLFLLFPPENKVEANCNFNNNDPDSTHSSPLLIKGHSPLIPGEDYAVSIVSFESCSKVFVHLSHEDKLRKEMLQLMKELFLQPRTEGHIQCGSYVVTKDFFRAKVLSINNSQVELFHIDLTDSSITYWTTLDQVRLMSASIAKYPEFCICCSMHRPSGAGKWQPQSNKTFSNLYSAMELVLTPVTVSTMKSVKSLNLWHEHFVLFYRTIGRARSNINVKLWEEETAFLETSKNCCDPFAFQPTKYAMLSNEEYCELYIFNASCCTEVEVCVIGEGFSDLLVQLEVDMFEYYSKTKETLKLPPVLPVDCIYAVLSEETCVRGKLISISFDQATVYLVDSGENDVVHVSALRPLQDRFSLLPMQAFKVGLCGLEHEACATHSKILQLLNETVVYQTCSAHIVGRFAHSDSTFTYMVELFTSTGPADTNVNQACYNLILEESLFPDIPSDGRLCDGSIGCVDVEGDCVFARLAGKGMVELNECMSEIANSFENKKILPSHCAINLYPGKLCLVKVKKEVFRARIVSITDGIPRGITVFLIDHGLQKKVGRGMILKLEQERALVIPPQAICCKLSEAEEAGGCHQMLSDVSDTLKVTLVLLKFHQVCDNEDFHVSLWLNTVKKIQVLPKVRKGESVENESQPLPMVDSALPSVKSSLDDCNDIEILTLCRKNQNNETTEEPLQDTDALSSTDKASEDFVDDMKHNSLSCQSSESDALLNDSKLSTTELVNNLIDKKTKMQIGHPEVDFVENPILVRIEEAESPDYLQMIALKNLPARNILTTALTIDHYRQRESNEVVGTLEEGKFYTLCDTEAKCCYRVRLITRVNEEVSVYLIDYAECRLVKAKNLTALHEKFRFIKPLMITAKLSGIESLAEDKTVWDFQVSDKLSKFIKGNCYYAHVLKVVQSTILQGHDVWEVCLCDTMSKNDVWINDLLVDQWACAKYVE